MNEVLLPREIYNDTEVLQRWHRDRWNISFEDGLSELDGLATAENVLDYLDGLQNYEAQTLFTYIPPQTILANYGHEALAWACANATLMDLGEELREALTELAGYNKVLFEKARLWAWQKLNSSRGQDVLSQYAVMEGLLSGALDQIDLPALLRKSVKEGVDISEQRLGHYSLIPLVSEEGFARADGPEKDWYSCAQAEDNNQQLVYGIWLDAPTGFAVTYKGRPQAVAAIATAKDGALMIHQLQGVQGKIIDTAKHSSGRKAIIGVKNARGLAPLDWQKLMVNVATNIATQLNISAISIQAGEHNKWANIICQGETEPHLSKEAAIRAYDVPAERLGFKKGKDGNWHKSLKT